jgi:hypothetical protein
MSPPFYVNLPQVISPVALLHTEYCFRVYVNVQGAKTLF